MTVTPDDPNFGNKHIEDQGRDLLSDRLFREHHADHGKKEYDVTSPDEPPSDFPQSEDKEELYEKGILDEWQEANKEETYDPDDPAVAEQRRLLSIQFAAQLSNNVEDLITNAARVAEFIKSGSTTRYPEPGGPSTGQDGADPGTS